MSTIKEQNNLKKKESIALSGKNPVLVHITLLCTNTYNTKTKQSF